VQNRIIRHRASLRQILRGGGIRVTSGDIRVTNNSKSNILGNRPTTTISSTSVVNPISVFVPKDSNDAEVFCYFVGSSGDPKISISDDGTTTNFVRSGSSQSGTQLSLGSYARYVIHASSTADKTVYITLTYNSGSTSFGNYFQGPGAPEFLSAHFYTGTTAAGIVIGDAAIFQ